MKDGRPDAIQIIEDARKLGQTKTWWAEIVAVGNGSASAKSATGQWEHKRLVGNAKVGDTVKVKYEDGSIVIYGNDAVGGGGGSGQVIFSNNGSGGVGGSLYPLPHAPSHYSTGSDPISPANIGAATPAQITASMNAHLAAADPHPQYLLSAGDTMTGPLHMTTADLTGSISSNPFASGSTGWQMTVDGDGEERNLHIRSSLYAEAFVFDLISTQAGTLWISKNASSLSTSMVIGAGSQSIKLEDGTDLLLEDGTPLLLETATWRMDVKDPPGTNAMGFDAGDIILVKSEIVGVIRETWFIVSAGTSNGDGTQHYTCAYAFGDMAATYGKDTGVVDFGASDGSEQGVLKATVTGANGPYYDALSHFGQPWLGVWTGVGLPLGLILRARLGKLSGVTDDTFGALSGYGLYSQNAYLTGGIKATFGTVGPLTIAGTKMYMGAGNFRTDDTPFYVDHNGSFSLTSAFHYNALNNLLVVKGEIHSDTGDVGGWTVGPSPVNGLNGIRSGGISLVSDGTEGRVSLFAATGGTELARLSKTGLTIREDTTASPSQIVFKASIPSGIVLGKISMSSGFVAGGGDSLQMEVFPQAGLYAEAMQGVRSAGGDLGIRQYTWWDPTTDAGLSATWSVVGVTGLLTSPLPVTLIDAKYTTGLVKTINLHGTTTIFDVLYPYQHTTSGGPAYVKGGVWFDTTLGKLMVGGNSGWETVTSV
jgi:hypothetical protein